MRSLRLKWVGHILRKDESFPARRMLMNHEKRYEEGSVLMDAPTHDTMEELAELNMGASVYSTPVVRDGVMYILTRNRLWAIQDGAQGDPLDD